MHAAPQPQSTSPAPTASRVPSSQELAHQTGIATALRQRLGASRFDRWFTPGMVHVSGATVEVVTESGFVARWIESQFAGALRQVASEQLGASASVAITVRPADPVTDPVSDAPGAAAGLTSAPQPDPPPATNRGPRRPPAPAVESGGAPATDRRPGHRRRGLRRLDTMVAGDCNRLALAAAHRLVEESEDTGMSPLFIHGGCGVGKTHLLQGICEAAGQHVGSGRVRYYTGEQFTNEFIAASRDHALDSFRKRVRNLELLAIDDVQFISNKERTQQEFHHTLDAITYRGGRVVLASTDHPRALSPLPRSLISRLVSGLVVELEVPDHATKIAIIDRLAATRGLPMDTAARDRLAAGTIGSIRELEGRVTMLTALHSLLDNGRGRVDQRLVDTMLRDSAPRNGAPVRVPTIIQVVCNRVGTTPDDVMGSSRHQKVVIARALVAYLARELTSRSYPEIARELGRTCHSTIHSAASRIARQISEGRTVEVGTPSANIALSDLAAELRAMILA